jgi:hypothetical protein
MDLPYGGLPLLRVGHGLEARKLRHDLLGALGHAGRDPIDDRGQGHGEAARRERRHGNEREDRQQRELLPAPSQVRDVGPRVE